MAEHLIKDCYTLAFNGEKGVPTIGLLSRILDITRFVVIGSNIAPENVTGDYNIFFILLYLFIKPIFSYRRLCY